MFSGKESEAVFTWREEHVAGQIHSQGGSFVLEGCGHGCFLWIRQTEDWQDERTSHAQRVLEPLKERKRLRVR